MQNSPVSPILSIIAGAMLLFERPAYAYADPGTGLLATQAVGSALVAPWWYLRKRIHFVLRLISAASQEPAETPTTKEDEGATPQ
jgi:hypothetical protein